MGSAYSLLLDEDVPPEVAVIGRNLGLAARSIYELDRTGWSDEEQLRAAGTEGCIFVTYNRDDFIELTRRFFHESRPHAGVLIVPWSFRRDRPAEIAHHLDGWVREMDETLRGAPVPLYSLDFLR